jgi:hypothetical protein
MVKDNFFLNKRDFLDLLCNISNVSYCVKKRDILARKPTC